MAGTRRSVESSLSPAPEQDALEAAGLDSGSELSELTDEEAETLNVSRPRNWSRRRRRRHVSRRGGRKKRSSLVPAPMWGWVEKNAAAEEEEEEELSEPPRAMEEEEGPEEEEVPEKEQNDEPDKTLEDDDEEEEEPQPDNETESDNEEEEDAEEEPKLDDEDEDKPEQLPPVGASTPLVTNPQLSSPPSPSSSSAPSSRAPSPAPIQEPIIPRRIDIKSKLSLSRVEDDLDTSAQNDKSVDVDAADMAQDDAQEDIDVDEPVLEDDLETELDLQPAHRAEALDELAIIELKFALLRERLYVEKMQTLAWEETLVDSGTHPELLHIQKELSKRRDKRLELAARKRTYEIANVHKRRRIDENATWSWWKHARDDLQTEMIAEANRKRRRLERERRVVERPQPVRRIPNFPVEISIPPSVRTLVDSYTRTTDHDDGPQTLVYPQLTSLSASDVANDLDFFALHRQSMYDSSRNATSQMGPTPLPPPPIGYDYNESFPPALTASRPPLAHPGFHHPQAPQQQQMVGPGMPFSYSAGLGRPPPSQHHTVPAIHAASSFPVDQDPSWPLPGGPGGAGVGYSPHSFPVRRSMSPPAVKSNGQWMGPGMGVGGFHMSKAENEEDERREREKRERGQQEIDRDRQRAYHLESLQQQHRHGPTLHQHTHSGPPPPPPPPPPPQGHHHHSRHHHHVLHHHPPPPNGPSLSPRASREVEAGRHPTEIINLSSSKPHWKDDYREKRPGSATAAIVDDRERPLAMPFTMSASHHSPPHPPGVSSPPLNSWNQDEMYRPSVNHDSSDRYGRMGLSERPRTLPPPSPSSSSVPLHYSSPSSNPARSPARYRERSPPMKVHRPNSPPKSTTLPPLSTPVSRVSSPLLSRGFGDRISDRDQTRELHSPRPPSKMTVNQMID